mmetsp:Transcript_123393/g.308285  ORF Transcript_123393/g.308285 Transcript_123393/m.308285 type:complete len:214 (+) Transcript_123393:462-1103(+)
MLVVVLGHLLVREVRGPKVLAQATVLQALEDGSVLRLIEIACEDQGARRGIDTLLLLVLSDRRKRVLHLGEACGDFPRRALQVATGNIDDLAAGKMPECADHQSRSVLLPQLLQSAALVEDGRLRHVRAFPLRVVFRRDALVTSIGEKRKLLWEAHCLNFLHAVDVGVYAENYPLQLRLPAWPRAQLGGHARVVGLLVKAFEQHIEGDHADLV